MIDYIYKKYQNVSKFYSTCFEYGTLGEGLIGQLKSLKTLVLENQAFYYGTKNNKIQSRIDKLFKQMFFPEEKIWKENFENDSKMALRGILSVYIVITPSKIVCIVSKSLFKTTRFAKYPVSILPLLVIPRSIKAL